MPAYLQSVLLFTLEYAEVKCKTCKAPLSIKQNIVALTDEQLQWQPPPIIVGSDINASERLEGQQGILEKSLVNNNNNVFNLV